MSQSTSDSDKIIGTVRIADLEEGALLQSTSDSDKIIGVVSIADEASIASSSDADKIIGAVRIAGAVLKSPSDFGNATVESAGSTATNQSAQAFIDDLVSFLADSGASGTFDISGGTYAAPTLPVLVIDFNNLSVTGSPSGYGTAFGSGANIIEIDSGVALAASEVLFTVNNNHFLYLGVSDTPTKQQIITKLVALGGGKIVDLGGLIIRVSPANYDLEPLDFTGMTGSSFTQGSNDIGTIRANGASILTN